MADKDYMKPIGNKSIVQCIVDRITQAIIDGELKPGERIPTETELSQSLNVGRNTVREAIRILVAYGVLEIQRPRGTFVCNTFKPIIFHPMLYSLIFKSKESYDNLIELRRITENGTLQLLWQKGLSESQKQYLNNLAENIAFLVRSEPNNTDVIAKADKAFHDALAEMTQNELVIDLNDIIVRLTYDSRCKTIEKIVQMGESEYLIQTHFDLLKQLSGERIEDLYQAIQNSYFFWKDAYK